jgi:hypothetical protein
MRPSTQRTTQADMTGPAAIPMRAAEGADAEWTAWIARGVEHDRAIRHRLRTAGLFVLVAASLFAAAWLSFGGAQ